MIIVSIVLNEREYAIDALRNCEFGDRPTETLGRIAKYYRSEGYKKSEIYGLLENFMLKCDPSINIVKWQETIEKQVNYTDRFHLVEIDSIPITQKELDVCDSVSGKQAKRLLFTLICLAKFSNAVNEKNNGWVNRTDKEIFRLSNITTSTKRQSLMLNDLRNADLIKFSRKVDNININVTCIDNAGDPVLFISDYRNLGYQYMRYCGEPYFECSSCGAVIKKTGKNQKCCSDCAIEVHRQKVRDNFRNKNAAL